MSLSELQLHAFKNHPDRNYTFNKGINCIVGRNGVGKTNLLDALNYLAFARTALGTTDAQTIRQGEKSFTIRGLFTENLTVACNYELRKGKVLKVNGEAPDRISDHVGRIPLVFTTPDDSDLIREGSEHRRRFFDSAICQVNPTYLKTLISFLRTIRQRNEHLKQAENGLVNHRLLDTYDSQLIPWSVELANSRQQFLDTFKPFFQETYQSLHPHDETPDIVYHSDSLDPAFAAIYKKNREKDVLLRRTTLGAHKDKFDFYLNKSPIRKFGSQGQQKTFIIALRLAEFDFLKHETSKSPLLLLDDIFDKLDDQRITALAQVLNNKERFEQIFITDARKERSLSFFDGVSINLIELL